MKNITVSVDDELYRRARTRAADDGTTVSAVVKKRLREYIDGGTEAEMRADALRALFQHVDGELRQNSLSDIPAPGWRDRMYDERFDDSILGRALAARGA